MSSIRELRQRLSSITGRVGSIDQKIVSLNSDLKGIVSTLGAIAAISKKPVNIPTPPDIGAAHGAISSVKKTINSYINHITR